MSAYSATCSTCAGLHHLGDDRQARPLARLGEEAETLQAEPLERVRARPRLERAAPEDGGARRLHRLGGLEQLVARLDRAGPGRDRERAVADRDVADADDRVLGVELARGELEGPGRPGHRLDAGEHGEPVGQALHPRAALAEDGHDDVLAAAVLVRREAFLEDRAANGVQLLLGRPDRHHHEHLDLPRIPAARRAAPGSFPDPPIILRRTNKRAEVLRPLLTPGTSRPRSSSLRSGHAGPGKEKERRLTVPGRYRPLGAGVNGRRARAATAGSRPAPSRRPTRRRAHRAARRSPSGRMRRAVARRGRIVA